MHSIRKGLALMLIVVLAVLAGCGGKKEESKATPPAEAKKDPVKISFWHGMGPDSVHGQTVKAMVKEFNEKQKDVIVEETYQGSYGDLDKKVTAAIAANTPPTVIQNTDSMLTALVKAKTVMALDSLLPAADKADYPAALLEAQTFDGRLYAVPFNKSLVVLMYNKKLIPTPPKTWAEFRDIAKKVTVPNKIYGTVFEPNNYTFGNYMVQAGGEWVTKDQTKSLFNSDAGVQALQLIVDMVKEGSATQTKPKEYSSNYFNEGRVAMIAATSASFAYIKPASGDPWGVALLPAGPKNDLTGLSGANLSIVSGVKPQEAAAAMKFMLYMTGKDGTLKWAMAKTGYMPVRKSAVEAQAWKDFVKANPEYEVMSVAINKGTVQPNHPSWAKVQGEITTAVEKALLGQATPKGALDEAAKKGDEILAKK